MPLDISINLPEQASELNTKINRDKDYNDFLYATCYLNVTYKNWFSPKWNKPKDFLCRYNCFVDYYNRKNTNGAYDLLLGKYSMIKFCFEIGACIEDCFFLIRLSDELYSLALGKLTFHEFVAKGIHTYCLFEFFTDKNSYDLVKSNNYFTKPFKLFLHVVGHVIDCLSIGELSGYMVGNYSLHEIDIMKSYMSKFMNSRYSSFFKVMLESNIKNWYVYHEYMSFDKNDKGVKMFDFSNDPLKFFNKKRMSFLELEHLLYF